MSTDSSGHAGDRTLSIDADEPVGSDAVRLLALGCVLVLTGAYVSVLYDITRVVGGSQSLLALVGVMLLAATGLARTIRPRTAGVLALVGAGVGFAYYLTSAGVELGVVFTAADALLSDTVALATGLPILRMVQAGVWTLGFAPAPVFLSWYLALRGRYELGVVPGGIALGFLVLTGDAGTLVTLAGTLAAVGAVAFGELERRGGSIAQADLLAVLFAVIVALSLSVTIVPGDPSGPTHLVQGEAGSLEATIDSSPQRSGISGQVDLSPEVRFTVESDQRSYWRTGVYDRFTGDEWVRTGQSSRYNGRLASPPGNYETVQQTVTAETELGIMPVAPQPLSLGGDVTRETSVSRHGQPRPETPLEPGESYTVESAKIDADPAALRAAGTNYPEEVTDRHLQTPEDTSSEFRERTAEITAEADTPYEKAAAIESHLRSSKDYSLEVTQPAGNVAEGFLLEMDKGYCVYFATTMTQMLREEGVPARYVTGYTSGQQVDDDEYVVRGLDAHSWVEVYFPDHGWVRFDPTPGGSRDDVHTDRLEEARANGNEAADTEDSEDVPIDEDDGESPASDPNEPIGSPSDPNEDNGTDPGTDPNNGTEPDDPDNGTAPPDDPGDRIDGTTSDETSLSEHLVGIVRETGAIGLIALVGLAAGARRTGAATRLRRGVGVYWHGFRAEPDQDAERAFRRLERLLAREYRPRRGSESARAYLTALSAAETEAESATPLDPRVEQVLESYERAVYGDGVSRAAADEAIEIVDDLARSRLPILGRLR
ncbi:DUF3488 and transglutaminase-like domain-containing protein [Natrinema versiforme]|uniref:Transglutaminase domain-containing protein n=1 Tax=Natrinema versiforme JCM 10478 TaxID=1227496 RepID=L9Y3Q9_9EURY|nr:DUF3488 and transglutaminase-like domain-containing protein [Natrinema versiforme]ELY68685.1 transglutaminase domain-containing protein [Natrinema versiforme JCM 10478]